MATITLSGLTVAENPDAGTVIGLLSVNGAQNGETFTYALADSLADRFEIKEVTIDGVTSYALVVKSSAVDGVSLFDFETKELNSFPVTITATSDLASGGTTVDAGAFDIAVTDVNEAPTGLTVTGGTVAELSAIGTQIATLAGIDPDQRDVLTYTFVADENGSPLVTDNAYFRIEGDKIVLKTALDDAQVGAHDVWVQITDAGGLSRVEKVTITVTDTKEITGNNGNNRLVGTGADEYIKGLGGNDKLYGNGGNDTLSGGSGKDFLYGGAGNDTFVFDTPIKKGHFDHIMDFKSADDTIQISLSALKAFKVKVAQEEVYESLKGTAAGKKKGFFSLDKVFDKGKLESKFFAKGHAKDTYDFVTYDSKTGFVYLDLDGSGGSKGFAIAKLKPGTYVQADDFVFI